MSSITGSSKDTWQPVMTANTTVASYWLNWRFFLCALWVLILMTIASILIWRNEHRCEVERDSGEHRQEAEAPFYDDETWRPLYFTSILSGLLLQSQFILGLVPYSPYEAAINITKGAGDKRVDNVEADAEQGACVTPSVGQSV
ncbi:PROTEIN putative-RELATED [Salix koriyanagi]|uniref:PROTEIN putative-RELATED n=1 Tax=Salix koriyanagi TaxID=2511006 RepID=A0A9Q0SSW7_9ROSI|nr:PROTEIN putative-RELATED [Salix koriyanagi]